jgi:hypothetical protein
LVKKEIAGAIQIPRELKHGTMAGLKGAHSQLNEFLSLVDHDLLLIIIIGKVIDIDLEWLTNWRSIGTEDAKSESLLTIKARLLVETD